MIQVTPHIEISWLTYLKDEFSSTYFATLKTFLLNEKKQYNIFPPGKQIFAAYDNTSFDKVKVVIIGQDPYHARGQANGLCFSVSPNITIPPSLENIFKELESDLGYKPPKTGDLTKWAREGVFLLNAVLTVRENYAGSHRNIGWENFTDATIKAISDNKEHVVFMLWGNYAKAKRVMIDETKHFVLTATHPSPLSANKGGFFGCKHFSKANNYLVSNNIKPINWDLN